MEALKNALLFTFVFFCCVCINQTAILRPNPQNCFGTYDPIAYNDLYEKVCRVCYKAYYEPVVFQSCIHNCFMNNNFTQCVNFVIAPEERSHYMQMARELAHGFEGWYPRDYKISL